MARGLRLETVEEARPFLREFIAQVLRDPDGPMQRHSREYDLWLPWVWEEVQNARDADGHHASPGLDRLMMEAAWFLVQQGYLRPGPRKVSSEVRATDYGKGFSLTTKGEHWVREE